MRYCNNFNSEFKDRIVGMNCLCNDIMKGWFYACSNVFYSDSNFPPLRDQEDESVKDKRIDWSITFYSEKFQNCIFLY
jgi:hypothetical protein